MLTPCNPFYDGSFLKVFMPPSLNGNLNESFNASSWLLQERQLQERLKDIERDHRLYTMEEDEVKVQEALLKPERTHRDSLRASRQLSRRYPGLPLDKALRSENAKLRKELDHMRVRSSFS